MPRRTSCGSTCLLERSERRVEAVERELAGVEGKSCASIARWIAGCLWPVKPTKRTLPCRLAVLERLDGAAATRSAARDRCRRRTRGSATGRGSRSAAAAATVRAGASPRACRVRACTAWSSGRRDRADRRSPCPSSLPTRPSWYSHALSMKVTPASIAACTRRIASRWLVILPR